MKEVLAGFNASGATQYLIQVFSKWKKITAQTLEDIAEKYSFSILKTEAFPWLSKG